MDQPPFIHLEVNPANGEVTISTNVAMPVMFYGMMRIGEIMYGKIQDKKADGNHIVAPPPGLRVPDIARR